MAHIITAKELVAQAGFDPAQIGKTRCRVGGVPCNTPDHLIHVQDNITEIEVVVGQESKTVTIEHKDGHNVTAEARKAKELKGRIATKKSEELQAAKKAAEKAAKEKATEKPK